MVGQLVLRGSFFLTLGLLVSLPSAGAAPLIIDNNASSGSTTQFTWTSAGGTNYATSSTYAAVANNEVYAGSNAATTATWQNFNLTSGFVTGATYGVYVDYLAYTSEAVHAVYTVNGAGSPYSTALNQTLLGNQSGASGLSAVAGSNDLVNSGWVYLGNYALNNSSNVTAVNSGSTLGVLAVDAVRLQAPAQGLLLDPATVATSLTTNWNYVPLQGLAGQGTNPAQNANGDSIQYLTNTTSGASLTYHVGSVGQFANNTTFAAGAYSLDLSWGTKTGNTGSATFHLFLDGNTANTSPTNEFTFVVDQTKFANGIAGSGTAAWSGYLNEGNFNLTSASIIQLINTGAGGTTLAADELRITPVPEPASGLLLLFGAAAILLWRKSVR